MITLNIRTPLLLFLHWLLLLCFYGSLSAQIATPNEDYLFLRFETLPTPAQLDTLKKQRIELLEFLPPLTYLSYSSAKYDAAEWLKMGIISAFPVSASAKLSESLQTEAIPAWALVKDHVLAVLQYYKNQPREAVLRQCQADGIEILTNNGYDNFLRVRFPLHKLNAVAALPYVEYLEPIDAPGIPDDQRGRALHRSNLLDPAFSTGQRYDGTGVRVLVRDDGAIGPHIDFQGRVNNAFTTPEMGNHGEGVAGILAGAGNLDPLNKGMAAGASIFTLNYEPDFLDETMSLYFDQNTLITNTSYSQTCNGGYTATAAIVDQQLYENAALMHVFSAGNFNGNACNYGAGPQWGNITGGHKQAKNGLTVGNIDSKSSIVVNSSRGPASDGRIKPDLCAYGNGQVSTGGNNDYTAFGGTSASAPGVSGVLAQLHQAYRELNNGQTADGALLKAILLNSATDLGNPGPDYTHGWGGINAWRAFQTIEKQHFFKSMVAPGQTMQHNFFIPTNVVQAKIMVYWSDPPASPMASKALVNDLDTWLKNTAGNQFLPWALNPAPDPVLLAAPAIKGTDTLNNVEQMVLDNPAAGSYSLSVLGKTLPFGPQAYYVVWEFLTTDIKLTYPAGGESFEPGDTVSINWDANGHEGNFSLSWSNDGGNVFNPVAAVAGNYRQKEWVVPSTITGQALLKITRGNVHDENDVCFSIVPRPENVRILKACPDFLHVIWDEVNLAPASDSVAYVLWLLGEKYMEPLDTVAGNEAWIPTFNGNPGLDYWMAVSVLGEKGLKSERTVAILHNSGLVNCSQQNDLSLISLDAPLEDQYSGCSGLTIPVAVTIKNTGTAPQTGIKVAYQTGNSPSVVENIPGTLSPEQTFSYVFNTPIHANNSGSFPLKTWVILPNDQAAFDNFIETELKLTIYEGTGETLDYAEDFEGTVFPPGNFLIINDDAFITWDTITVTGSNGLITSCLWVNNFDNSLYGSLDVLQTPLIDLAGAAAPRLTFDVAYARHSSDYSDGLLVEVSTDCGATFPDTVFFKKGLTLSTLNDQTSLFIPQNASQWRTEVVDLTKYVGSSILLRFINVNGYGNSLCLDNIRIQKVSPPEAGFTGPPPVVCQGEKVNFISTSTGENISYHWNYGPGASPETFEEAGPVWVTFNEPGTRSVELTVKNVAGESTFSKDITIEPLPVPFFNWTLQGNTVLFQNTSSFATSYFWNFGDGMGGLGENTSHVYANFGAYPATLTASNACGSVSYMDTIYYGVDAVNDFDKKTRVTISPNPAKGVFEVRIETIQPANLFMEMTNVQGISLLQIEIPQLLSTQTIQIDGSDYPPGLYFLKIQNKVGSYKVLKIKIL